MTRPLLWLLGSIIAPWLALAGLMFLALGTGPLEVLCLELAAITVALIAGAALLAEGHDR